MLMGLASAGVLFAQGTRAPFDESQDSLLAEVRALRSEVQKITSAGIRTQLLIARLQLQDQRVLSALRQLSETQNTLRGVQARIAGERTRVRQLEDSAARTTSQGRAVFQQAILESGTQIEQQQAQEVQLQMRERDLQRTVSDEQARWTDFNDRLEALERSLP
jgi:chromosome segregation ATPase